MEALQKEFDLHMRIGIDDADKYLDQYDLLILHYGSNYAERLNVYNKYHERKQKEGATVGS